MPTNQPPIDVAKQLMSAGRLVDAEAALRHAIAIEPGNMEAHFHLGQVLQGLGRLQDAVEGFRTAIGIDETIAELHLALGTALMGLGEFDGGIAAFRRAVELRPMFVPALYNLGKALGYRGQFEDSIATLEGVAALAPNNMQIAASLIEVLSVLPASASIDGRYAGAQRTLRHVPLDFGDHRPIGDDAVTDIYGQCDEIYSSNGLGGNVFMFQAHRGRRFAGTCARHMKVFETFEIIPEYCFGCFKVTLEVRTLFEFFKLMFVLDEIELADDNPRKWLLENREQFGGAYKGFIYCTSVAEARDIATLLQAAVDRRIGDGIAVQVKHGCSEYPLKYPAFAELGDEEGHTPMRYPDEWRDIETQADNSAKWQGFTLPIERYPRATLSLCDVVVMRTAVAYAAKIGDPSYRAFTDREPPDLLLTKRPAFQAS